MTGSPDSASLFFPTDRVPGIGVATYPAPDPSLLSGPSLVGGLDVQVTEKRADGWAHVVCSNGWSAWLDGRLLVPLRHSVPATGLAAWREPDPRVAPDARLDPGLEVEVLEQHQDGWARVVCTNGWTGWVDGRPLVRSQLQARGAPLSTTVAQLGRGDDLSARLLPLAAGIFVIIGAFLPWLRVVGRGISPWDISFLFLLHANTSAQPHVGPLLLVPAALILAYPVARIASGRPVVPRTLLAGGLIAIDVALACFARWLRHDTGITLGIGPFVVLAGGVLAVACHWQTRPAGDQGRWHWIR